jgi:hypothetical protein
MVPRHGLKIITEVPCRCSWLSAPLTTGPASQRIEAALRKRAAGTASSAKAKADNEPDQDVEREERDGMREDAVGRRLRGSQSGRAALTCLWL